MKRKVWKTLALVVALALTAGLVWMGEGLVGNPICKHLAETAAQERLETVYAGTDFQIDRVGYSFKDSGYYAHVKSPTSMDSDFTIAFDHWGRFRWDSYEDRVLTRENVARRIEQEYFDLAKTVFAQLDSYDREGIQHGKLETGLGIDIEAGYCRPYTLPYEDLELDRVYDVGALGAQHGTLVYYVELDTEDITVERAAQLLLELRQVMDQAGVGFRAVDMVLQEPLPAEGPRQGPEIGVDAFPYEDIYEEGLPERIAQADAQLKQKYAEMDQQKELPEAR